MKPTDLPVRFCCVATPPPFKRFLSDDDMVSPVRRLTELRPLFGVESIGVAELRCYFAGDSGGGPPDLMNPKLPPFGTGIANPLLPFGVASFYGDSRPNRPPAEITPLFYRLLPKQRRPL